MCWAFKDYYNIGKDNDCKILGPTNNKLLAAHCFRLLLRPVLYLDPVAWFFETRDLLVVNHLEMFRGQIASRFTEVSIVRHAK